MSDVPADARTGQIPARRDPLITLAIAGLMVMLIVLPTTLGRASQSTPTAAASATVAKQLRVLKRKIRRLTRRINTVAGAPATPTGPAGGVLAGSYPNPMIASGAVGVGEIGSNAVGTDELGPLSVGSEEIAPNAIGSDHVAADALGPGDLATGSVRALELTTLVQRSGSLTAAPNNTFRTAAASCGLGEQIISAGFDTPELIGGGTWVTDLGLDIAQNQAFVTFGNFSGFEWTFSATAYCLSSF